MFPFVFQTFISSMHGDKDVIPPSDAEIIPSSDAEVIPSSDAEEVESDDSQQENQVHLWSNRTLENFKLLNFLKKKQNKKKLFLFLQNLNKKKGWGFWASGPGSKPIISYMFMHKSEFLHGDSYYNYASFWSSTPEIFVRPLGFWRPSWFWAGHFETVHKVGCHFVNINAKISGVDDQKVA